MSGLGCCKAEKRKDKRRNPYERSSPSATGRFSCSRDLMKPSTPSLSFLLWLPWSRFALGYALKGDARRPAWTRRGAVAPAQPLQRNRRRRSRG
ncbi:hypothetical protein DV515_00005815 [Chloebia gouldiae]|uniref:Uncharacterized protein n=1 Tax=Chloebia gouldiae TaxID=44316 RepID=A0A3L8SMD9_CHLGU|nr:hypothetical protein DV515_00005815 [Chloebia gouldiae]